MDLLTAKEAAAKLRVTPEFIYKLFDQGAVEGFRAGRHLRIYAPSVDAYITSRGNKKRPKPESPPVKLRPLPRKPPLTADAGYRFMTG